MRRALLVVSPAVFPARRLLVVTSLAVGTSTVSKIVGPVFRFLLFCFVFCLHMFSTK